MQKEYYIEYLNKDKNFQKDKQEFDTWDQAVQWGKDNIGNFNLDMVKHNPLVKLFYQRNNIGRAKYTISSHDGVKTHNDGSPFYDIDIFRNKKDLAKYRSQLINQGYTEK